MTFLEPYVDDNALVAVVVAVENQRAQRSVNIASGSRNIGDDFFEHGVDVDTCLCRNLRSVLGRNSDNVLNLGDNPLGIGAGQINFVDYRYDFKSAVNREICVGKRLRLNTLRSVNNEYRALTCRERTRDLVVKVDVTWGVDQVKKIFFAVVGVVNNAYGACLYCNAAFAFKLHIVE